MKRNSKITAVSRLHFGITAGIRSGFNSGTMFELSGATEAATTTVADMNIVATILSHLGAE